MARSRYTLLQRLSAWGGGLPTKPRRPRQVDPRLDRLEGRVVPSCLGLTDTALTAQSTAAEVGLTDGTTATSAASTASSTPTTTGFAFPGGPLALRGGNFRRGGGRGFIGDEQLNEDLQQLRTDLSGVLSGSSVTDAQRLALRTDFRAIAETGFRVDKEALGTVVDSLLTALADGTYDSDATVAQSIEESFDALFADSSVDQTLIDQTYADLVAVARGLDISTEELDTLAADREAIQADLERLGIDAAKQGGPGWSTSNLDLVLSPGFGFGRGRGRGRF